MPMHVGALHVLELPAGFRGRFVDARCASTWRRGCRLAPVLRRRLWWMPLNLANPAWVDAEPDLREHIVEIKLPQGRRAWRELEAEVARLHPVLLDRAPAAVEDACLRRPGAGARAASAGLALYTQLHHAAVDGQAAVALANVLLDVSAEPRGSTLRPSKRERTFELGMAEMLRGALGSQAQKVAQIVRELPSTVGTLKDAALRCGRRAAALLGGKAGRGNLTLAPRTALNVSVTPQRAFAALSLADGRGQGPGAQRWTPRVNDMVLMLCSTALRRYHGAAQDAAAQEPDRRGADLAARRPATPRPDNQASMSLVSLGTHIADPRKRLAHVVAATRGDEATMGVAEERAADRLPVARHPLADRGRHRAVRQGQGGRPHPAGGQPRDLQRARAAGAAVPGRCAHADATTRPRSSCTAWRSTSRCRATTSRLDFGLMADGAAMPDVRELADAIAIAFDDLRILQGVPPEVWRRAWSGAPRAG